MEIRKSIAKNIHVNRGDSGSTRINKVVTSVNEEVDGGEELNDALNFIETAKKPIDDVGGEIKERVKNKVVDKVFGEDEPISNGTRKTTRKTARETTKKTGKESAKQTAKESGKKAAKETAKTSVKKASSKVAKDTAKKAVKETVKKTTKETTKAVVKEVTKDVTKAVVQTTTTAAGSAGGPYGLLIGLAAGEVIGEKIEQMDARAQKMGKVGKLFKSIGKEGKEGYSPIRMIADWFLIDLKKAFKKYLRYFIILILPIVLLIGFIFITLYTAMQMTPLGWFMPQFGSQPTLAREYAILVDEFEGKISRINGMYPSYVTVKIEYDGFEEDEEPEYSYVAPFAVYMVKHGLDRGIYVDDQSKKNLKEIFDAMCRIEYEETKTDEPPPEDETEEETETESESETETETEEEKEPDVKVTIYRMTAEEAAEFYDFSDEEIEQMNAFIELAEKGLEY